MTLLLTFWCVLVALGSLFFFGLPVAVWLAERDDANVWIVAPLIGLGVIILPLHSLVYLNLPVAIVTGAMWGAGLIAWLVLGATGRLSQVWNTLPRALILAALAVYFFQGIGLFLIGAQYYVARAWIDQFNYTAIAQFLTDYVFSMGYADIQQQPYLVTAITLKLDRIGVSLFQGFLGVSTFTDAKTVFESAILVAPVLSMLAVYRLASRLGLSARYAAFASVGVGVLPALTTIHVETFFSHALGTPYLFILPVLTFDWLAQPTRKRLWLTALALATGISAYTEFHFLFVGLIAFVLGVHAWQTRKVAESARYFLSVNLIAMLLNPGYLYTLYNIVQRIGWSNVLANIYPWAFTLEGLGRLWLGDAIFLARVTAWLGPAYDFFSASLLALSYLGLGLLFWQKKNSLALTILALAIAPFALRVTDQFPYQFYKLLLSVSPLFILGSAVFLESIQTRRPTSVFWRYATGASMIGLILLFCGGVFGTTAIAGIYPVVGRSSGAAKLLAPGARFAQDQLSQLRDQNVLIINRDAFMNAWLGYFSRHNRVWLANPKMSDADISRVQTFQDLPRDIYIVTSSTDERVSQSPALQPIWTAAPYRLGKIQDTNWALLTSVVNPNGVEDWDSATGMWLGDGDATIDFISRQTGWATVTAEFTRGPSLPGVSERSVAIRTDQNITTTLNVTRDGLYTFTIPVIVGPNQLTLRSLDQPTVFEINNGDARPLLLGVRDLHITLPDAKP